MKEEEKLVQICVQNHNTIGSCESLTAGLFSSTVASVPGASAVLKGSVVTYATEIKKKVVHVSEKLIGKYGVISKQCARMMALNTQRILDVDYCVSFTGNAGPEAWEGKPAGRVYCAIASREGNIKDFEFQIDDKNRNEVREQVVQEMIVHLIHTIEENENGKKNS